MSIQNGFDWRRIAKTKHEEEYQYNYDYCSCDSACEVVHDFVSFFCNKMGQNTCWPPTGIVQEFLLPLDDYFAPEPLTQFSAASYSALMSTIHIPLCFNPIAARAPQCLRRSTCFSSALHPRLNEVGYSTGDCQITYVSSEYHSCCR